MATLFGKHSVSNLKVFLTRKREIELVVIIFAILLAAFLGNYVALLATRQIANMLMRFIAGIIIGLLIGIGVGIIVKRIWEKVKQVSIK